MTHEQRAVLSIGRIVIVHWRAWKVLQVVRSQADARRSYDEQRAHAELMAMWSLYERVSSILIPTYGDGRWTPWGSQRRLVRGAR